MQRALRLLLFFVGWIGAGALAVFAVGVVLSIGLPPVLSALAPLGLLLLLPMLGITARLNRRQRAIASLTYLEQALRLNLPLPQMLLAAQHSESPRIALNLQHLRELLEAGTDLPTALEQAIPGLPDRVVARIGAAERLGSLPQTLAQVMHQEQRRQTSRDISSRAFSYAYPVMMLLFLSAASSLMLAVVMPRFQAIFRDFHLQMPWMTRQTMLWAQMLGPAVLAAMTLVALALLGRALWEVLKPLGPDARLSRQIVDRILWILPVAGTAARDRALGDSCQVIADALARCVPMDHALRKPSHRAINCVLALRLDRWAQAIEAGAGMGQAVRRAALPPLLAGLVATAQTTGDLEQIFSFLARYYRSRFTRLALLLQAAVVPAVVLAFALCVGWVAVSLFLPLMDLINAAMPWSRGL